MLRSSPRSALFARFFAGLSLAAVTAFTTVQAQIPGRNVNMVSGTKWPDGDPFLQRQNEPSIAASTRNPLHMLAGSNDYRTVDLPFPSDGDEETGDAWLGLFKSFDGGQRWISTLLPGYPQDQSPAGLASPLKGYEAGADAVVRAGTNGLIYFSGLAFNRGDNGNSGIFITRFIDNNNKESGDPIAYLGTSMVASATGAAFLDKPWMAVDIPRGIAPTCTVSANSIIPTRRGARGPAVAGTQRIPAGAVYIAYSSITGADATLRSQIMLTRSLDCGASWSTPFQVSRSQDPINQGASIAIDPRNGNVYVSYRRFSTIGGPDIDAMMVARLPSGARRFDEPWMARWLKHGKNPWVDRDRFFEHRGRRGREVEDVAEFDQGSSPYSFRSNAYPTMAMDATGRLYIAWSERGFAHPNSDPIDGDARIVITSTVDGRSFTPPFAVDDDGQLGHQIMPTMAFAGGKLMLVYYDLRETKAGLFSRFIADVPGTIPYRHTIDIRAAMGTPGGPPAFTPSVKVSDYLMGINPTTRTVEQLQANPPNLPMFRQGTTPFIGDYIDVAPAPAFVPTGNGRWAFNTATSATPPVFHAAWTDNRDVRPPRDGNWTRYTPASMSPNQPQGPSLYDGVTTTPICEDGNAGSRNQNVYTSRITGGLLAGSPGNAKPLSTTLQRGFVVFAQNATTQTRSFRMSIRSQPVGGRASFEQFGAPSQPPLIAVDMKVPPRSTASRTVYATSSDPHAGLQVDVVEITQPGGAPVAAGLGSTVLLNPDVENPDLENPDVENPDVENPDIQNAEAYNPDIENPDVENPDFENPDLENVRVANPDVENPDLENPDLENPDVENVRVANPDIANLTVTNPDIENPDLENPDLENPDMENPDIENGAVSDVTWKVSNTGNTTAAFNVNVFLAQQNLPTGVKTQLILFKTYRTPVTVPNGCQLGFQTRNVLVASIPNPTFIQPASGGVPDQNDPSDKNASMWLSPGEEGRITLRVIHDDIPSNLVTVTNPDGSTKLVRIDPAYAPATGSTPAISSQGVGTLDKLAGETDPPLVTPTGANLFFLQMPTTGAQGVPLAPPVSVQVRNNLTGTPVSGATVTLTLGNNPGSATLSGDVAVSDAGGIANFPSLSLSAVGTGYTLTATATTTGVIALSTSTAFDIIDVTPPSFDLDEGTVPGAPFGPANPAEASGPDGAVVTYTNPTATDNNGGPVTVACGSSSGLQSGSTFPIGTTAIDCIATDVSGVATPPTNLFNIIVADHTPPVITVTGAPPAPLESGMNGGAIVTYDTSAIDAVSGGLTPTCTPASGSLFAVGTTTVTCDATDAAGNAASNTFVVVVLDTTPPVVAAMPNIATEATQTGGAVVSYSNPTATDLADTNVDVSCAAPSGTLFPLGSSTVTCTATDDAGNHSSVDFHVNVVDTTPPMLTVPGNITTAATSPAGATVTYAAPTAVDIADTSVQVVCSSGPGVFPIGTTTVSCTATDHSGNATTKSFTVTVTNTAPVASGGALTTNEDTAAAGTLGGTDVDGPSLTFSIVANPSKGTATITNPATGAFIYTPNPNVSGADSFTFKLNDGIANSNTATVAVTVNAANDAPGFVKGANQSVIANTPAKTVANWATAISRGPADESGQTISFIVSNNNGALFAAQPAIGPTGTLTYKPADSAKGVATVTVAAKDNGGTANGGQDTSTAQTFTITVDMTYGVINKLNLPPSTDTYFTRGTTVAMKWQFATGGDGDYDSDDVVNSANALPLVTITGPTGSGARTYTFTPEAPGNGNSFVAPSSSNGYAWQFNWVTKDAGVNLPAGYYTISLTSRLTGQTFSRGQVRLK